MDKLVLFIEKIIVYTLVKRWTKTLFYMNRLDTKIPVIHGALIGFDGLIKIEEIFRLPISSIYVYLWILKVYSMNLTFLPLHRYIHTIREYIPFSFD